MPPQVAWRVSRRHLETWVNTRFISNDIQRKYLMMPLLVFITADCFSKVKWPRTTGLYEHYGNSYDLRANYHPTLKYWCLSRKHDKHSCNLAIHGFYMVAAFTNHEINYSSSPCWKKHGWSCVNLRWLRSRLLKHELASRSIFDWFHKEIWTL